MEGHALSRFAGFPDSLRRKNALRALQCHDGGDDKAAPSGQNSGVHRQWLECTGAVIQMKVNTFHCLLEFPHREATVAGTLRVPSA